MVSARLVFHSGSETPYVSSNLEQFRREFIGRLTGEGYSSEVIDLTLAVGPLSVALISKISCANSAQDAVPEPTIWNLPQTCDPSVSFSFWQILSVARAISRDEVGLPNWSQTTLTSARS